MSHLSGVWSERNDPYSPNGAWRDCTQSSYLMVLCYGEARIPNAFTIAERERFEDAEGLPEFNPADGIQPGREQETGLLDYRPCDRASLALYGVQARPIAYSDLYAALHIGGQAFALSGMSAGLPSGYQNAHSVCVVSRGDDKLWVYDPLASMGSGPTVATVDAIMRWHAGLRNDRRVLRDAELAVAPYPENPEEFAVPVPVSAGKSGYLFVKPGPRYSVRLDGSRGLLANFPAPSGAPFDAYAQIAGQMAFRVSAGAYKGQYFREADTTEAEVK